MLLVSIGWTLKLAVATSLLVSGAILSNILISHGGSAFTPALGHAATAAVCWMVFRLVTGSWTSGLAHMVLAYAAGLIVVLWGSAALRAWRPAQHQATAGGASSSSKSGSNLQGLASPSSTCSSPFRLGTPAQAAADLPSSLARRRAKFADQLDAAAAAATTPDSSERGAGSGVRFADSPSLTPSPGSNAVYRTPDADSAVREQAAAAAAAAAPSTPWERFAAAHR